jgi:hypothetical protein
MKANMTYHAREERIDRLTAIVDCLGDIGEIILETPSLNHANSTCCLTSLGVVIVKGATNGVIITGYLASMEQVMGMFYSAGFKGVPHHLKRRVSYNNRTFAFLKEM